MKECQVKTTTSWKKGFLLGRRKNESHTPFIHAPTKKNQNGSHNPVKQQQSIPPQSRSDLLAFENQNVHPREYERSPFLLLSDPNDFVSERSSTHSQPVLSVKDEMNQNHVSSEKRHLMEEVHGSKIVYAHRSTPVSTGIQLQEANLSVRTCNNGAVPGAQTNEESADKSSAGNKNHSWDQPKKNTLELQPNKVDSDSSFLAPLNQISHELSTVLFRVKHQQKLHRQKSSSHTQSNQVIAIHRILVDFVDSIHQGKWKEICQIHNIHTTSPQVYIWDHILEAVGDIANEKTILHRFMDETSHSFHIALCEKCVDLPSPFLLALCWIRSDSGEGWTSLLEFSRSTMTDGTWADTPMGKSKRSQLLGVAFLVYLHSRAWKDLHDVATSCIPLLTFWITQMLPFLVQVTLLSSDHGLHRTLLSSMAYKASCYLVEWIATVIVTRSETIMDHHPKNLDPWIELDPKSLIQLLEISQKWCVRGNTRRKINVSQNQRSSEEEMAIVQCKRAIVNDWYGVITNAIDDLTKTIPGHNPYTSLWSEFAGYPLLPNRTNCGGFAMTLCSDDAIIDVHEIIIGLQQLIHSSQVEDDKKIAVLLRIFCSWLVVKDRIRTLRVILDNDTSTSCVTMLAFHLSVLILLSTHLRSIALALPILKRLLLVIEDFIFSGKSQSDNSSKLACFMFLCGEVTLFDNSKAVGKDHSLQTGKNAIIDSVGRILLQDTHIFLPTFLSNFQSLDGEIEVLLTFLRHISGKESFKQYLRVTTEHLLSCIPKSEYAQRRLCTEPSILSSTEVTITVEGLMKIIALDATSTQFFLSEGDKSLSAFHVDKKVPVLAHILSCFIEANVSQKSDEIAASVVAFLSVLDTNNQSNSMRSVEIMCKENCPLWWETLSKSIHCNDEDLGTFLCSIARQMFLDPSNRVPLYLFSSMIGNPLLIVSYSTTSKRRVINAINAAIEYSVEQLMVTQMKPKEVLEKGIFDRLSPILLLRCIPHQYLQMCYDANTETDDVWSKLANVITTKLGVSGDPDSTSSDEKRLLAELAGRYLPFSFDTLSPFANARSSCYKILCEPIFSSIQELFLSAPQARGCSDLFNKGKFAMYACCIYVSVARDDDSASGMQQAIDFAFCIFDLATSIHAYSHYTESVGQLHLGCVELIALCLEAYCNRHRMIMTVESPLNALDTRGDNMKQNLLEYHNETATQSFQQLLDNLFRSILFSVEFMRVPDWSAWKYRSYDNSTREQLSYGLHLGIINSMIIFVQRCKEENGNLHFVASSILPIIVVWLRKVEYNGIENSNPTCVTAVIQLCYTLLIRTKNLRYLDLDLCRIDASVHKTYEMTIRLARIDQDSSQPDDMLEALRSSAIKFAVAIISIDLSSTTNSILTPKDLFHFIALNSKSDEARQLTETLLLTLRPY